MIKISEILYLRMLRPVFFVLAFGLYHAFYAIMWLKSPRKDFKKEYNNPYGDISGLTFVLILIFFVVIILKFMLFLMLY